MEPNEEPNPRPSGTKEPARLARVGIAALGLFSSCQTYEPRPVDLEAHRAAWAGRVPDEVTLRDFLERLPAGPEGSAKPFELEDGLDLEEGRLAALVFQPELRLARLAAARAAASADEAGRWEDPELSLDVLRITRSVPSPWIVSPGLAFSIPLSGRLAVERRRARWTHDVAEARVREEEWRVSNAVRRSWFDWTAARLRAEETARFVEELGRLSEAAARLAQAGELEETEAALFGLEEAHQRNELLSLAGEAVAAEQALRAAIGLAPDAPVEFLPALFAETGDIDDDFLGERNPTLVRLFAEYQVAEATLEREIREQVPDLTLGPLYESDEGQSRVGLLGALPLPFFDRNRREIAEARADRELARAAYETAFERLAGRRAAAEARAAALAERRRDAEAGLVPLVDRQLESARSALGLGEGTPLVLLESLSRAHRTRLDLVEVRRAEAHARTEIAELGGPRGPLFAKPRGPQGVTP